MALKTTSGESKSSTHREIQAEGIARVQLVAVCIFGIIVSALLVVWIVLILKSDSAAQNVLPVITTAMGLVAGVAAGKRL